MRVKSQRTLCFRRLELFCPSHPLLSVVSKYPDGYRLEPGEERHDVPEWILLSENFEPYLTTKAIEILALSGGTEAQWQIPETANLDPDFWRKVAVEFRDLLKEQDAALPTKSPLVGIVAHSTSAQSESSRHWELRCGSAAIEASLEEIVSRSARGLGAAPSDDALSFWFQNVWVRLRGEESGIRHAVLHESLASIVQPIQASIAHCLKIAQLLEASRESASSAVDRRLQLEFDAIREKEHLTEQEIAVVDRQRQAAAASLSNPTPGRNPLAAKDAFRSLGLGSSVRTAEIRFRQRRPSVFSDVITEEYRATLEKLKNEVLEELSAIWKGRSAASDRWFGTTCQPEIERALTKLISPRVAQARQVEIQRLRKAATGHHGNPILAEIDAGGKDLSPAAQQVLEMVASQLGQHHPANSASNLGGANDGSPNDIEELSGDSAIQASELVLSADNNETTHAEPTIRAVKADVGSEFTVKVGQDKPPPEELKTALAQRNGEPAVDHIDADQQKSAPRAAVADERRAALDAYKRECRERGVKVTDAQIAKAASRSWNDRTPVTRWKLADPRSTVAEDVRIRAVLKKKPHLPQS